MAAVTNDHKCNGLQHECITAQYGMCLLRTSQGQNPLVCMGCYPETYGEEFSARVTQMSEESGSRWLQELNAPF